MSAAGRVIHAALELLDRQLLDRHDRPCGKVDDLELERDESGRLLVTAILAGPGVLATRYGHEAYGPWLERVIARLAPSSQENPERIPFGRVSDIGTSLRLAVERDDLATYATERWVAVHVVSHIPGARHAPE